MPKLSKSQLKALRAVSNGLVRHRFDSKGNAYEGPDGIGSRSYRALADLRLIEDEKATVGHPGMRSYFKQKLTPAGHRAFVEE